MYNYLKFEQDSVDQEYQKPGLKEKKNKKQSSMNSAMTEMLIFQQKQMKMTMQQQMFDLMNHFQQTQELHEQQTQQQQQINEQQHVYSHSQSAFSSQPVQYQDFYQTNPTVSQFTVFQFTVSQFTVSQSAVSDTASSSSSLT